MKRTEGEPATLGSTLAAKARIIAWCKACAHQTEPDIAEQVAHHGAGMTIADWAARLACSRCSERSADFVITGARR